MWPAWKSFSWPIFSTNFNKIPYFAVTVLSMTGIKCKQSINFIFNSKVNKVPKYILVSHQGREEKSTYSRTTMFSFCISELIEKKKRKHVLYDSVSGSFFKVINLKTYVRKSYATLCRECRTNPPLLWMRTKFFIARKCAPTTSEHPQELITPAPHTLVLMPHTGDMLAFSPLHLSLSSSWPFRVLVFEITGLQLKFCDIKLYTFKNLLLLIEHRRCIMY